MTTPLQYTNQDVTLMKILCFLILVAPFSHFIFNYGILLFFAIVGISIYYLFRLIGSGNLPKYSHLLWVFVAIWFLAWFFSRKQVFQESSYSTRNTTELLTPAIVFFLLFYPFYFWSRSGCLTYKRLKVFFIILLIVNFINFLSSYIGFSFDTVHGSSVNAAYPLVCLMPLVGVVWDRKNTLFYLLLALVAISFLSAKRGAMLSALASFLIMLYYYSKDKNTGKIKIIPILLMLLAAAGVLYYIYSTNVNLQIKIDNTSEGNYSGRENIYLILWEYWLSLDFHAQLFGEEFMKAVDLVGFDAHNDWLEILLDVGLVEAAVYLLILLTFLRKSLSKQTCLTPCERYMLSSAIIIWITRSCISDGFTGADCRYYMIAIAFVLGREEYNKIYSI